MRLHLFLFCWYLFFQKKAKEELKEWIKEYDGGVKNHGEPNTWDVTLVTDMSELFYDIIQYEFGMFYCASSFNQPITMDTSKVTIVWIICCVVQQ